MQVKTDFFSPRGILTKALGREIRHLDDDTCPIHLIQENVNDARHGQI